MAKKEFKVGEVFQLGLVKLRVEKSYMGFCKGCFFRSSFYDCNSIETLTGECHHDEREDKTDVIFVKMED